MEQYGLFIRIIPIFVIFWVLSPVSGWAVATAAAETGRDGQAAAAEAIDGMESAEAETETVAAAAEEQTTATTEVAQSANDLAGRAAHLSEALDRFETEVPDEATRGPEEVSGGDISAPEPSARD